MGRTTKYGRQSGVYMSHEAWDWVELQSAKDDRSLNYIIEKAVIEAKKRATKKK